MENWKIIGQIAAVFGIVFVVFAAFAAFLEYETLSLQYENIAFSSLVQVIILTTMLPFLMLAVLSFVVSALAKRGFVKENIAEEAPAPQMEVEAQQPEE
jgi:heme/copper-type cytochrome/quinol oxidase subunit 2